MPLHLHDEILSSEQKKLLPLISSFSKEFGLVGGTAVALYIGHRRSIDFDLFTFDEFDNLSVERKVLKSQKIEKVFVNKLGEYTIFAEGVKITFFHYPHRFEFKNKMNEIIKIPDLATLAAMKAYALGMRAKWKDYVDMYFIMEKFCRIDEICNQARKIFGDNFNEKIFRAQLSYFDDIDHSEKIDYIPSFEIDDEIIKKELTSLSLRV